MKKQVLDLNALGRDEQQDNHFTGDLEGRCSEAGVPDWTEEFAASGGGKSTTTAAPPGGIVM